MYGYIYKTTNILNNKIYIGKRKGNYDNKYYGSGKYLWNAINKYGIENFKNELLFSCKTLNEINLKEIETIKLYRESGFEMYNIALGGDGGNVISNYSKEDYAKFVDKMTKINKQRCNTKEFKEKLSHATKERYKDENIRKQHSQKIKEVWSDEVLKKEQSDRLKEFYKNKGEFEVPKLFIKHSIEYKGKIVHFESRKHMEKYLKEQLKFSPCRRTLSKMIQTEQPYKAFHRKNDYLNGLIVRRNNEGVTTMADECKPVQ